MKPTAQPALTTSSGRVLSEADIERWADEAAAGTDRLDLDAGTFLRDYKGGYEDGIVGPILAVRLDAEVDQRLTTRAAALGRSESALVRDAVAEYVADAPANVEGSSGDLSEWQWLLHLDSDLNDRMHMLAKCEGRHVNAVINDAVRRLLASA